jgi:phospholipid/cholesterol/gamma-HCH transport system substrate-binding protein
MKPLRERNPVPVALAGLVILVGIALLAFYAGSLPLIGGGTGYTAYFSEAAGLTPGNEVRIAGVTVGHVSGLSLDGAKVAVTFTVRGAWVGNTTSASIQIKTLLGDKYLALDPSGSAPLNPSAPIPLSRTTAPYDVTQAFSGVGQELGQINTAHLAQSLQSLSDAFSGTPPYTRQALKGLASLSQAVASRDAQLAGLLSGARSVTKVLASEDSHFQALLGDGNLLLSQLRAQQKAIHGMLTGTEALATQLSGLVHDDQATLGPALSELDQVTSVLQRDQADLGRALALAGPFYRLLGNSLGNGRWFDVYLCGLVPRSYVPQAVPRHGCMSPKPAGGR